MRNSDATLETAIAVLKQYTEKASYSVEEAISKLNSLPESPTELGLMVSSYTEILASLGHRSDSLFNEALNYLVAAKEKSLLEEDSEEDETDSADDTESTEVPKNHLNRPKDFQSREPSDSPTEKDRGEAVPSKDDESDSSETSFEETYPEVDADSTLEMCYERWLAEIENKPFFKTIKNYKTVYLANRLDVLDRTFLLRLIKAVSSLITHIVIEAELRPEAIVLLERYYDDLVSCMNLVVHSADKEDIYQAFTYVLEFLQLIDEEEKATASEDNDEF